MGSGDTGVVLCAVPYDLASYLGAAADYRYRRPLYSPELEAVLTRGGAWTRPALLADRSPRASSGTGRATPR